MRTWRRLYVLLAIALVVTPLLALAPVPLSPVDGVREASAAPTFYLPWEQGSVWQITHDGNSAHHANEWNWHAWDAVPDAGRSTNRVTAIADGVVLGFQNDVPKEKLFSLSEPHAGNCMLIRHNDGTVSIYAHLATGSIPGELLREGVEVRGGTVIGTAGDTGSADGVHLHWSLTSDGFMYEAYGYRTCAGHSIPSTYADSDAELIEDGGIPRPGRFYESFNSPSGAGGEVIDPAPAVPAETAAPPETSVPTESVAPVETSIPTDTAAPVELATPAQVIVPIDTVVPTEEPAPSPPAVADTPIDETGSGGSTVPPSSTGAKDISLITRDPDTGGLLTGTCYILLDYSNEGCDENSDGQVTFDDMPPGTYTVHQTQAPAGYPAIKDFPLTIDDLLPNIPVGYIVKQAPDQHTAGTRNVSVVFVDADTRTKIVPASICVQFATVSNVGCDRDLVDGQVDFLDLAVGTHEVTYSNMPSGWQLQARVSVPALTIEPGPGPQIIYIGVFTGGGSAPASSAPGTQSGSGSATSLPTGGTTTGTGFIAVVGGGQTDTTSPGNILPGQSSSGTASAGPAVELILDTSDSMNERDQGGQTRIEVAKTVTTRLVTETLPAGVPMALRTYAGCSSSLAIPMQPLDPNAATGTIANLRASGKTPIAQSLRAAGDDLSGVSGPKIIVLVTDGDETCGGDPRAVIEALVAQDVSVHVNIVGFAIDDAALTATFQEWARVGNGTYFDASNAIELDLAVTTASQLPFRVLDEQGAVIADGAVGGEPVGVPAGTYTVEVDTVPLTRVDDVVVTAQQTTTIDLDALGSNGAAPAPAPTTGSAVSVDLISLLPSSADVPSGLVETGRHTRPLSDVVANYIDPAGTSQRFTAWGWQGNAVASFALPSGQEAQSGQINGVYVSIHHFGDAGAAREALDFSIAEDTAGSAVYEVSTVPLGEYTRAMYGTMDYGNEIIILVQQGDLLIRVAAAMLDGNPTGDAVAVTEAILLKAGSAPTTGSASSSSAGAPSSAGSTQDTWTASVQVVLCDATPGGGTCQAGAGITVNISLASGEWIGSCTTSEPTPTPWGVSISTCAVEGLPFYADLVATQDPSTIPEGYVPRQESVTLHVEGIHPGGGDEAIFNFSNVRTDTGSTGSTITADTSGSTTSPAPDGSGEATLLMTFRGCPEGFDPATGDFWAECTEPLDAPDDAFLNWGGDGQGGRYITELDRQYDGAYVHNAQSATMNLRLTGLAPVVRDDYQVIGVDGADGNGYTVSLADDETREVYVFYWFN